MGRKYYSISGIFEKGTPCCIRTGISHYGFNPHLLTRGSDVADNRIPQYEETFLREGVLIRWERLE
jgi:hypothetical protein